MGRPLTPRQIEVLQFIEQFYDETGYAPTLEEIRAHLGLGSVATVHKHLKALEAKGAIHREEHRSRSVELAESSTGREAPLLGLVAAGQPIEAVASPTPIEIPAQMDRGEGTYVLRVRGDSMIDEHIADGDLVVVRKAETAHNGQLVVALVDGETVTLKRLYHEGQFVRLQPANPRLRPMILSAERVQVQAVVVGLLREY